MTTFGAGSTAAGATAAGLDPAGETTTPTGAQRGGAERFDLATKDYEVDPDTGLPVEAHPIDQMMSLGWGVEQGSVPGQPTLGRKLRDLVRLPHQDPRFLGTVRARMLAANPVAQLIASGEVKIIDIAVNTIPTTGNVRHEIVASYFNTRTGRIVPVSTRL